MMQFRDADWLWVLLSSTFSLGKRKTRKSIPLFQTQFFFYLDNLNFYWHVRPRGKQFRLDVKQPEIFFPVMLEPENCWNRTKKRLHWPGFRSTQMPETNWSVEMSCLRNCGGSCKLATSVVLCVVSCASDSSLGIVRFCWPYLAATNHLFH